jgi:hypothetical protein
MEDDGIQIAKRFSSHFIESLTWNVPNNLFGNQEIDDDVRGSIAYLYHAMGKPETIKWGEVNELTYLFHNGKPTQDDAKAWAQAVWNHCGYD